MVRPIMPKLNPAPRVDPKANAAQIAQLEAQAAQLREQIRLANKMGEREWAASARQELDQVTGKLDALQQPDATPANGNVPANAGTPSNGAGAQPALYTQPTTLAFAPVKLNTGTPEKDPAADMTAHSIIDDVKKGKSINKIASERGMTNEQVLAAIRAGNNLEVTVTDPTSNNGDVQTTVIRDTSDPRNQKTVTLHYDYQHDTYYAAVQDGSAAPAETPVRDGLGRKQTSDYDPKTGAMTTRYEDDLGSGVVTERTSLPNGASVETVTPKGGSALPVTTVTGPDGKKTVLAPTQDPGGATTKGIQDDLAKGKSIDQIAKDRGLTKEQVIAELQGAGYQVKTGDPKSDNGDVQSVELADPHTGEKIVYYNDYQHDARTVVTTKGDTETTVSEDGNGKTSNTTRHTKTGEATTTIVDPKAGTEIKIVTDKDGRVTKTTTEKVNDGKPIDYEVKPDDNLTLIAQKHGVTLDELRKTNPELFDTSRDPNLVRPGEKIRIENGTRTTVEVTANGYTLTTKPDGSVTLHNNTTGTDLKIDVGTTQEALARTLLAVNPNSSDPAEAKEGQVVKSFVEGILAGQTLPSLIEDAKQAGLDKAALMKTYGAGILASPKLDGQNRVVDPFGDPPRGKAPSGGNWVPMKVDGAWTWVDPQVAQAIIKENIALSRITETRALAGQGMSQFNVYMLDPAYKDAVKGAQGIINEALAPYGLEWTPEKPEGTLADAQNKLTQANNLLKNAQDARGEYERAGQILTQAINDQSQLKPISDPNAPAASALGQPSPNRQTEYAEGIAAHAAVDKLFGEAGLHLSKGDKLTIDFLVGQADLNGMPKDSQQYKDLKTLQGTADKQFELAGAYQGYFDAHARAMDVGARQTDLEQRLLAEYGSNNQYLFEPGKKHSRINGDYLGLYQSQELQVRDGQLWVVNHFEKGTTEQQLTFELGNKNVRSKYKNRQLNKDWQQLLSGNNFDVPMCTANGLQSLKVSEAEAAKNLNDILNKQLGDSIKDLGTKLTTLQTNFDNLFKQHGPGSVDVPAGTLPDGVQPVEIDLGGGRKIKVAPEVAAQFDKVGLDALTQSGKAVWIDLDTSDKEASGRWVDPSLAVAKLVLEATQQQKTQAEELRRQVEGFSDYHNMRLSDPSLMVDRNTGIDRSYLDKHQQEALDGNYQPKFQQLFAKGFDNTFHERRGSGLDDTVANSLGIDRSTKEGRDAVSKITKEIRDIGGDTPKVRAVPLFYVDDKVGTQQVILFAVQEGGGTRYVDVTGKSFANLGDFQDNNAQFGEDGKLVAPKNLQMKPGSDGKFELEVVKSRNFSVWEKAVDPLVGIGTGIATILSFTPAAPVAAPLAYAGAAYLGTRAVINQVNHLDHGGEWGDTESLINIASVATTVLPMASSGLRTVGMAGKELTAMQAFRGSIGATRSGSAISAETRSFMQTSSGLNKTAWGMDVGAVVVGTPLLATSGYDLLTNWNQMTDLQRANALTGFFTGVVGTGLGLHGLRTLRPGTDQGFNTNGGANQPPPRGGGANQPPPWGGGGGPRQSPPALEAGPSGKPMNVHEMGADGVYRPTGEQVFHDPSHPVIPGEVVPPKKTRGDASTTGAGRTPHESQPTVTAKDPVDPVGKPTKGPAGGDPIIVPNKPVTTDGPVHLVWNPETRSFSGMPERDTGGYTYTSGKDERTPSAYLDGLTNEQLLHRYETEKSYYSSREMADRYGPDGVYVPRTPIRDVLPDLRVGVTFRTRLNTGQAFGIGSPTVAAIGFGVGTKTDFGAIGWSIVDSFSQRSLTPLKDALSTQGVVSYRAREYRNITALQAGVWPVSKQTALPVRASDLSGKASEGIFNDKAGYEAKPFDAAIVGKTPDGEGTVIEMTYSPSLKGTEVTLAPGQHDFFGVPAENNAGHVRLEGALPFGRVMTETKAGLRLPIVANHVGMVDKFPRVGIEMRPELPVKDTLQKGDIVSKQTYDQIQSALGSTVLKIQFVVKDPAKAGELVTAVGQGNGIQAIRDLVKAGQIDPSNTVSYADEPTISGLRLSAVPGKTPSADIVLLTGEKVRVLNPEAMLVDIIFNDRNGLPGVLGTNPDKIATSLTYKVKSTVKSWLPARVRPDGTPQPRYMPSAGNIYKNLYGADGTPATRYTVSLSTPQLPAGALAFSAEVRFQYKSSSPKAARSIAKDETAQVTFKTADGQSEELTVPAWIARAVEPSRDGAATGIPKGGKKSLDQFLDQLETTARPDQMAAIAQFRGEFGRSIVDGGFMRQNVADGLMTLLSSQVGRRNSGPMQIRDENGHFITATRFGPLPKSAESVYVPPADGPQARGDEPDLMHKSHIFFRDPETGEAYVLPWTRGASEDHVPSGTGRPEGEAMPPEAAPARKALEAAPPTTFSLQQIRNMRQPEKWKAGEVYTRELNGSLGEVHFPVQANPTGPHPVFGDGGRYVDAPVFKNPDVIEAIEVKTYHRWTTIKGVAQMREVPLTPKLQEQINKDVALRNENPKCQPRWVFLDAPPSAELQGALDQAGIVGNIFGHNKPAAAVETPRTIELKDKDGEVIVAAMLGTEPRGPEQVYIPPVDGPRLAADAPETLSKTHILVYDPDSGEPVVLPWIRGASEEHVPDGTQSPPPGSASNSGPHSRDAVRAIPLEQVQNLNMAEFQPTQIPWLKPEQVAALTEQQFHNLDRAGLLPYLTKSQLRGIPKAKTSFLNIAGLDERQIPWVTKGQVSNMTGQQFVDLGVAGLTHHLIKPQVQAIKGDTIEFVDVSTLENRQIQWFKPGQVAKFTSPQFERLGETGLLKNLGERQVQAIPETMVGFLNMTKFDPKQVPWLTEKQIPALTRDQWGGFTIHHTEALTQPQIEAVTAKQFEEMSPGQFRKFTLEQFEWMGVDQTNALSVLQLTTFRATHKKSMTPEQRVLVDSALAYSRTKEYKTALETFGAMASTSYTLWSTLPPTWTATAGAVSFGVRGLVFGTQAIFPNATAAHKPFGRFLNALGGATFIAAAPGAATGLVQGKDLVVNSTFTLGNMVYGTKSMLQSFTGRPVIRNLAEYLAGPGYVLGCAVYTVNSWPAPIATVAGAMFTFGCAEFWASAIRTDRVNSRSVPRADAETAAAEKSDKKWAAWDRWTLGITFGVGMLLFSLDALLGEPWNAAKPPPIPDPEKSDDKSGVDGKQPGDGTDKPDPGTKEPPQTFPQLVVLADDGLNLRAQPSGSAAVVTVLQPGSFVEQTAKPSTDSTGTTWLPVEGYGPDGKMHTGWVSGDLVKAHPDGASTPDGRTNPKLEQSGYRWVDVKSGDSIRLIATTNSTNVADTVVLNMDHILSPDIIFAGDRIYLPTATVG